MKDEVLIDILHKFLIRYENQDERINDLQKQIFSIPKPTIQNIPNIKPLEDRIAILENKPEIEIPIIDLNPLEERIAYLENKPNPELPQIDLNPIEDRITALENRNMEIPVVDLNPIEDRVTNLENTSKTIIEHTDTVFDYLKRQIIESKSDKTGRLIEVLKSEFGKLLGSGVKGEEYKTALAIFNALKELDKE